MATHRASDHTPDSAAIREALRAQLCAAVLPGDDGLECDALDEAVEFVFAAAQQREPGRSAIRLKSATGERRLLRIAVINDDMPFLVDSIAGTITAAGLSIDRLVHPVVAVERDANGGLARLGEPGSSALAGRESMVYIETPRVDARQRRELLAQLRETLGDVRAAVSDWPELQAAMAADAKLLAPINPEASELLDWLHGGMLTQLGHITRHRDGSETELFGICRKSTRQVLAETSLDRAFAWFEASDTEESRRDLLIIKANRVAQVHRRVPLDLFIVAHREDERVVSISIHAGVWTSAALAAPPRAVPMLRRNLEQLTVEFGFDPSGHAGKALIHAFTVLPHDLMVGFGKSDIRRLAAAMMSLVDRPRPKVVLVPAQLQRHVFAFVWLPRDLLSTEVRLQIQSLLTRNPGTDVLDWSLAVEGGSLAQLEFLLDVRSAATMPDAASVEGELQDLLRGWGEAVEHHLAQNDDSSRVPAIAARYAGAFPQSYRARYGAAEAARDIERLRLIDSDDDSPQRGVRLYHLDKDADEGLRLKIYHGKGVMALSDAVPALENFGFRVVKEVPTELQPATLGAIHEFTLSLNDGESAAALLDRAAPIEQAIADVLNGKAEDDPFNRLVISTALAACEANWLRAFYRYLRQTGMSFTIYPVVDALAHAPDVTRALIKLFIARHDPHFDGDRERACGEAAQAFANALIKVVAINDDRLLRLYKAVIDAILRTNAFAPAASEALAFKLDSSLVPGLPKPVPWREIFVYSARVEGIHLRSGAIARGGLRWSDRRDDFRTEILGLMKAQKVKNAVIVPSGAKGGFYPKQLPSPAKDRAGWAAEGQASYELFIRTLLSVTDNIVGDAVEHPGKVVIHDGEDPYFVVAADKGTARFSDVANAIALRADFWLGDAFASGGSNGYDHKAMGITARGGWVSVQRHFLEMGVDIQSESVRVAGCGDMSGDVFGNGMLLSQAIKLVAAFDHRHIFIDPDPDPMASWQERKRLFELPSSSWDEYDKGLISAGGGVWPRDTKSIALPEAARAALGIDAEEIEPDALVSAILKAPVELFWFGGIGTYIKAESESHADVGDHANDGLRVSAGEVRARVIGEGANLGVTQAGRIAFALGGGRINTDFIDNSAGVDCSDNEVNIKIALAAAIRAGDLAREERNTLLVEMTDEVAAIVLEHNRLQALALSIAEEGGADATASYVRLIERLEEQGDLDRENQGLASGEVLIRRAGDGAGLTRPELAVLLSSAKLVLQHAIEASDLPDDPALEAMLIALFPAPMRERFAEQIRGHRLRRELIATELANRIINRLGLLVPFELAEEEGVGTDAIAKAFVAAEQLFDLSALWHRIDTAEMSEATRILLFERAAIGLRGHMADLLRAGAAKQSTSKLAGELAEGVAELARAADALLAGDSRDRSDAMQAELIGAGAPAALAAEIVQLFKLDGAIGLARLARDSEVSASKLTDAFGALGVRLGLDWAQGTAALMEPSDVWERLLVAGLARDFQQMRLDFLRALMRRKPARSDPLGAIEEWASENETAIRQFKAMVGRAQTHTPVAPAVLAQIASQARNLLDP
jgi:glutamate dehydrogenase